MDEITQSRLAYWMVSSWSGQTGKRRNAPWAALSVIDCSTCGVWKNAAAGPSFLLPFDFSVFNLGFSSRKFKWPDNCRLIILLAQVKAPVNLVLLLPLTESNTLLSTVSHLPNYISLLYILIIITIIIIIVLFCIFVLYSRFKTTWSF